MLGPDRMQVNGGAFTWRLFFCRFFTSSLRILHLSGYLHDGVELKGDVATASRVGSGCRDGKLMAVLVKLGSNFEARPTVALFQMHARQPSGVMHAFSYDVSAAGQKVFA